MVLEDIADPEALVAVKRAMDWLASPEGQTVAGPLLQNVERVQGSRLKVMINPYAPTCYVPGKNYMVINPKTLKTPSVLGPNGTVIPPVPEMIIAHELVHGGQSEEQFELLDEAMDVNQRFMDEMNEKVAREGAGLYDQIKQAPDYARAVALAGQWVDEVKMPALTQMRRARNSDPLYQRYLQEVEGPAIEVENKIAVFMGRLPRVSHDLYDNIPAEQARAELIKEVMVETEAATKPGGPNQHPETWQAFLEAGGVNGFDSALNDTGRSDKGKC